MTEENEFIIVKTEGKPDQLTGRLLINRPRALNALSKAMCAVMNKALIAWAGDPTVKRVLITSCAPRAFCAGGDIRALIPFLEHKPQEADAQFSVEYILQSIINSYPKPIVVIGDGLTMGAGSGVLLNASHPIITEKMDFSMPETAIGFFPDVAASIFLRRAKGYAGVLMGMTGFRIRAVDMRLLGLVDRQINSTDVAGLTNSIIGLADNDGLDSLLDGYVGKMIPLRLNDNDNTILHQHLDWINRHFSELTPALIRKSLDEDDHPLAEEIRNALDSRSPLSITIAHELLTNDEYMPASILDAIAFDYILACRICRLSDFAEGVQAVLIDKNNNPKWMHKSLADVDRDLITDIFARPTMGCLELRLPAEYIPLMNATPQPI